MVAFPATSAMAGGGSARKDAASQLYSVGELVEVKQLEPGLRGSWHPAVIVKVEPGKRVVRYDELYTEDDMAKQLEESIAVSPTADGHGPSAALPAYTENDGLTANGKDPSSSTPCSKCAGLLIRPRAPKVLEPKMKHWKQGMAIEMLQNDAWWEGVLLEDMKHKGIINGVPVVHVDFPDENISEMVPVKALRHGLQWCEHGRSWAFRETSTASEKLKRLSEASKKRKKVLEDDDDCGPDEWVNLSPLLGVPPTGSAAGPGSGAGSGPRGKTPGSALGKSAAKLPKKLARKISRTTSDDQDGDMAGIKLVLDMGGEQTGQGEVKRKRGRPRKSREGEDGRQRPRMVQGGSSMVRGAPSRQLRIKANPGEASVKSPGAAKAEPAWGREAVLDSAEPLGEALQVRSPDARATGAKGLPAKEEAALKHPSGLKSPKSLLSSSKGMKTVTVLTSVKGTPVVNKYSREVAMLVEAGVLREGQRVEYRDATTKAAIKTARVSHGCCLVCTCCNKAMNLSELENHTGKTYRRPAKNIWLEDGRSLHQCKAELGILRPVVPASAATGEAGDAGALPASGAAPSSDYSDELCRLCGEGGELLCCDSCPATLHLACAGLEAVPDGDWYCPLCRCSICGKSHFQAEGFGDDTILYCDQCSRQYHVACLRESGRQDLKSLPKGDWFCTPGCRKVFKSLRKLVGQTIPLPEGFFIAILREPTLLEQEAAAAAERAASSTAKDPTTLFQEDLFRRQHRHMLALGLDVMKECFHPIKDNATQEDLIPVVVKSGKCSLRDCSGFYTFLLGKGKDAITAASVRVYGREVAEMPLIGTRFSFRRQGMCRRLMNELERLLSDLGVNKLVLPAVPEAYDTWKGAFGFENIPPDTRKAFLALDIMSFPGTKILEKPLHPKRRSKAALQRLSLTSAPDQAGAMSLAGAVAEERGAGEGVGGSLVVRLPIPAGAVLAAAQACAGTAHNGASALAAKLMNGTKRPHPLTNGAGVEAVEDSDEDSDEDGPPRNGFVLNSLTLKPQQLGLGSPGPGPVLPLLGPAGKLVNSKGPTAWPMVAGKRKSYDMQHLGAVRGLVPIISPRSSKGRKLLAGYRKRRQALQVLEPLGITVWYVGLPWMPVEPWWREPAEKGKEPWRDARYLAGPPGWGPSEVSVKEGVQWLTDVLDLFGSAGKGAGGQDNATAAAVGRDLDAEMGAPSQSAVAAQRCDNDGKAQAHQDVGKEDADRDQGFGGSSADADGKADRRMGVPGESKDPTESKMNSVDALEEVLSRNDAKDGTGGVHQIVYEKDVEVPAGPALKSRGQRTHGSEEGEANQEISNEGLGSLRPCREMEDGSGKVDSTGTGGGSAPEVSGALGREAEATMEADSKLRDRSRGEAAPEDADSTKQGTAGKFTQKGEEHNDSHGTEETAGDAAREKSLGRGKSTPSRNAKKNVLARAESTCELADADFSPCKSVDAVHPADIPEGRLIICLPAKNGTLMVRRVKPARAAGIAAAKALAEQAKKSKRGQGQKIPKGQEAKDRGRKEKEESACISAHGTKREGVEMRESGLESSEAADPSTPAVRSSKEGSPGSTEGRSRRKLKLTPRGESIVGGILGDREVEPVARKLNGASKFARGPDGKFITSARGLFLQGPHAGAHAKAGGLKMGTTTGSKGTLNFSDLEEAVWDPLPAGQPCIAPGFRALVQLAELLGLQAFCMALAVLAGSDGPMAHDPRWEDDGIDSPSFVLPGSCVAPRVDWRVDSDPVSVRWAGVEQQQPLLGPTALVYPRPAPVACSHEKENKGVLSVDVQIAAAACGKPVGDVETEKGPALKKPRLEEAGKPESKAVAPEGRGEELSVESGKGVQVQEAQVLEAQVLEAQGPGTEISGATPEKRGQSGSELQEQGPQPGRRGEGLPVGMSPVVKVKEELKKHRTKAAVKKHVWTTMVVRTDSELERMEDAAAEEQKKGGERKNGVTGQETVSERTARHLARVLRKGELWERDVALEETGRAGSSSVKSEPVSPRGLGLDAAGDSRRANAGPAAVLGSLPLGHKEDFRLQVSQDDGSAAGDPKSGDTERGHMDVPDSADTFDTPSSQENITPYKRKRPNMPSRGRPTKVPAPDRKPLKIGGGAAVHRDSRHSKTAVCTFEDLESSQVQLAEDKHLPCQE